MTAGGRWRRFFYLGRGALRSGVDDELEFHLAMKTQELIAAGMDADAARRRAIELFGRVPFVRDECVRIDERKQRRDRRGDIMTGLMHDVRYSLRGMRASPGFTVVVALTLALGIGANAAMFSILDGVLLKPLPYAEPDRLVSLSDVQQGHDITPLSFAEFQRWREEGKPVFSALAALFQAGGVLTQDGEPMAVTGARFSAALPRMLGVHPIVGRTFTDDDDLRTAERTIMISERLWRLRYSASADVIGKSVVLNGNPFRVIGVYPVAPRSTMPFGYVSTTPIDFWLPLRIDPTAPSLRGLHFIDVVGQLKPGVTPAQASAFMAARQAARADSASADVHAQRMDPLAKRLLNNVGRYLTILMAAVAFVLVIACVNVANLLLARAASRQRELAVRIALGASRANVVTQLLVESLLRALIGGALGLGVAYLGLAAFHAYLPARFPRYDAVQLDGRVFAFLGIVSVVTAILFGLVPAWQASRTDPVTTMREGGRGTHGSIRHDRVRRALVIAEVALSFVLLVGAALLLRSLKAMLDVPRGFDTRGIVTAYIALPAARYPDGARQIAFFDEATRRIATIPGVRAVTFTTNLPVEGGTNGGVAIPGSPFGPDEVPIAEKRIVSPNYFDALGAQIAKGRAFRETDREGSETVVIVNESFARRYLGDAEPIGRRVDFGWGTPDKATQPIVGIVSDIKEQNLDAPPAPAIYIPLTQRPVDGAFMMVRTDGDATSFLPAVRRRVQEIDRDIPLAQVRTLDEVIGAGVARQRFAASLVGAFSGLALFLAALGLYGLISYAVVQRTSEFGVRTALGAQRRDIVGLVLSQSAVLIAIGVAAGVAVAFGTTRVLSAQLFGVGARDPWSYAMAAVLLVMVAICASAVPSWRATRVDPMSALREDRPPA